MPSPPTSTSPPTTSALTAEEKKLVAVVCGEAIGENQKTWEAVTHVIMNRKGQHEWRNQTITEILNKNNFTSIDGPQYRLAMEYMESGRDPSFKNAARYEQVISTVIPIYNGEVADITNGAVFFSKGYNPKYYGEEVFIEGVTKLRFFKYPVR